MKNTPKKQLFPQSEIESEENTNIQGKLLSFTIFFVLAALAVYVIFSKIVNPPSGQEIIPNTLTQSNNNNHPAARTATKSPSPIITHTPTKQPPSETPSITPTIKSQTNSLAQISCADVKNVNLRKSPGYVNKDDEKDVVHEVPCGEYVTLLGETEFVDDLTWWKVNWNGYEGWIADHTGKGKQILIFSQIPSFSQSNPTEFINWYFNALWQERNYDVLWDTYLTSKFQKHSSPGGIKDYSGWWSAVKQTDVQSVEVLENSGNNAWVKIRVTFLLMDGRVLEDRSYEYDLVYDAEKEIWMFDYRN